jgi:hypothetical protein
MTFDPAQGLVTQTRVQEPRQAETDIGQEAHQDLAVDGFPGASVELTQAMVLFALAVTNLDIPVKSIKFVPPGCPELSYPLLGAG